MTSPTKLAHVVLRVGDLTRMKAWYLALLDGSVKFEDPRTVFISYDEEHHRLGLAAFGFCERPPETAFGLEHIAFGYDSLGALLATYSALKDRGDTPFMAINHGVTTSLYYKDPEGNGVELIVENFDTPDEADVFMASPLFEESRYGFPINPDHMLKRLRAGEEPSFILRTSNE